MSHRIVAEGTSAQNVSGGLTDGGFNISSDASYNLVAGRSSRNSTNPRLLLFGNYSGSTPTMGLATNSPAIDAITNLAEPYPPTDQRGVRRTPGPLLLADVGAYPPTPRIASRRRIPQ